MNNKSDPFFSFFTLIEKSQPNVSRQKKEGIFPPGWAYVVGQKYSILTEWIMKGTGPMRISEEMQQETGQSANTLSLEERRRQKRRHTDDLPINEQLIPINEWLAQLPIEDRLNFLNDFRERFADFDLFWLKKTRKEDGNDIDMGETTTAQK